MQILARPSLRLRLPKKLENSNTYIVNIQYKCRSMGECSSYTLNCDYLPCTPTKQYFHHIFKHVDIALPSSKNTPPCCENELIGNT